MKLGKYIQNKNIDIIALSRTTGISANLLHKSFGGDRQLKADEFFRICACLQIDPMQFYEAVIRTIEVTED